MKATMEWLWNLSTGEFILLVIAMVTVLFLVKLIIGFFMLRRFKKFQRSSEQKMEDFRKRHGFR